MNQGRLNKVLCNMEKNGLEQLIITSPESIFYLLGEWIHPGERMLALYLNRKGEGRLFINALFPINRDLGVEIVVYNDTQDPIEFLSKVVDSNLVCGIDKEWPSHFLIRLLKKKQELKVEVGSVAVDMARMIKDEEERELMRRSSEVNDKAMGELIELIREGDYSEVELGKKLGEIYSKYDTYAFSFDPLICYGAGAAEPHHASDDTRLQKNQCIIIDVGGVTNNYCSDMTRSLYYGEPEEEYKRIYELCLRANLAGISAVKPGRKLKDVDAAARSVIEEGGYGQYFTHRTGHGIGIHVHEFPDVNAVNEMELEEGMVFSVEPGIYIPGKYGVRIEDLVLVTKDGCEVLNKFPKDLITIKPNR